MKFRKVNMFYRLKIINLRKKQIDKYNFKNIITCFCYSILNILHITPIYLKICKLLNKIIYIFNTYLDHNK